MKSKFIGTVYFNHGTITKSLGSYGVRRGHAFAMNKLKRLYPGGWLYKVHQVQED